MLQSITFFTLGELATGVLLFIALIPPSKIGKGFGRFHAFLALALWLVALHGRFSPLILLMIAAILLAAIFSGRNSVYYPLLIASQILSGWLLLLPDAVKSGWWFALVVHVPPMLVLGASSVSMLLGHWYLVTPKLPIGYLKTLTIGLIAAIVIRSVLILLALMNNQGRLMEMRFFDVYGIFFLQRALLGLLLTFILSILTYFCVRIRSTQSATGILYVVLVFCLVGEVIGNYLFQKTGISF